MTTLRPVQAAIAAALLVCACGARAETDSAMRGSIEPIQVAAPVEEPAAEETQPVEAAPPPAASKKARLAVAPLPPRRPAAFSVAALSSATPEADPQPSEGAPASPTAETAPAQAAPTESAAEPQPVAAAPADDAPTSAEEAAQLVKQTDRVVTSCFPADLVAVLDRMSKHFGSPVIVTSGYRSTGRRHSLHRSCKAADVQIAGVRPSQIIAFAKTQPEIGGIGAYRHTRSVHVDVREEKMSWFGRRGRGHFRVARNEARSD